jgi:hypothetical protein
VGVCGGARGVLYRGDFSAYFGTFPHPPPHKHTSHNTTVVNSLGRTIAPTPGSGCFANNREKSRINTENSCLESFYSYTIRSLCEVCSLEYAFRITIRVFYDFSIAMLCKRGLLGMYVHMYLCTLRYVYKFKCTRSGHLFTREWQINHDICLSQKIHTVLKKLSMKKNIKIFLS